MIPKFEDRKKAVELRKEGLSYNEIRRFLNVSKSSLSLWLRDIGLAKRQKRVLSERQKLSQAKGARLCHERRIEKTLRIKKVALEEIGEVSHRELFLIGVALYWAEGSKEKERGCSLIFSNSDPNMILLYKKWLLDCLGLKQDDLHYTLFIHERAPNIISAQEYWADFVDTEAHNISITYKKHNPSPKRKNIGVNYRGLIRIRVRRSIDINRKVAGWIDGLVCSI